MKKLGKKSPIFDIGSSAGQALGYQNLKKSEKKEAFRKKDSLQKPLFFERKAGQRDHLLHLISSRESMDKISNMSYLVRSNHSTDNLEPSNCTEIGIDQSSDIILIDRLKAKLKSKDRLIRAIKS